MSLSTACFIGLGNMGSPIAANLIKNKIKLYIYNRTKDKATNLIQQGASWIESPTEAFKNTNIVFSMVANDHALLEISNPETGILKNAKPNCIHISMSTVSPKVTRELVEMHEKKGVQYIAAPVFGRPDVAAEQKLWICIAGNEKAKKQVEPLLKFIGQKIYDFGDKPDAALTVKLSGNFLILTVVESLAEAFSFAEKSGVDKEKMLQFLTDSLFPSPVYKTYGHIVANSEYSPAAFKMNLGLKDIDLLLRTADTLKVPLPIAGLLHDRLMSGIANNRQDLDWSAIALTEFQESGLGGFAP